MKYKILGNTGLKVSTLCLGTMNYGGKGFIGYMGNLDKDQVEEQIKTVTEAGINFMAGSLSPEKWPTTTCSQILKTS